MDFFANLPLEVSIIISDYLDDDSKMECTKVSKGYNNFMSSRLLVKLNIPLVNNANMLTPYSQLMSYYKKHCDYFIKKLPGAFAFMPNKLTEAKRIIDRQLSMDGTVQKVSLLNEIWNDFIYRNTSFENPFKSVFISQKHAMVLANDPQLNPNEEMQILLKAGIHPDQTSYIVPEILPSIIQEERFSLETIEMLIDKKAIITPQVIIEAIKTERCTNLLPFFFASIQADNQSLRLFLENLPIGYQTYVESYIYRIDEIIPYTIRLAIEKGYPQNIILSLLRKCSKGSDPYQIRLAIEGRYSEEVVLRLLDKCAEGANPYNVRLALEERYPENVVLSLLAKCGENTTEYHIRVALSNGYSEAVFASLMDKIQKEDILKSLEKLIKAGLFENLVENFIPKAEGEFCPRILSYIAKNHYSENIFLQIFGRTDQEEAINQIHLGKVIKLYSAYCAELLIDRGVEVPADALHGAVERQYPEETIIKIVARLQSVEPLHIRQARQLLYSDALLSKMQAKCSHNEDAGWGCAIQ